MRLAEAVAAHSATAVPAARALCALFCFHAARFPARVGPDGALVLLRDQDRARYDRALLARGLRHLEASAVGDRLTAYHLEADIASCHSLAESYEATDWPHILECYDALARINPSPTVAVNRAVALARVEGPEAALAALEPLRTLPALRDYLPLYLALATCHGECGRHARSRSFLRRALALEMSVPTSAHVRRVLEN
jgi:RNA polymerase sigma-70 factor (ECF subfamily)